MERLLVFLVMLLAQVVSVVAIGALEVVWDQLFAEAIWAVSMTLAGLVLQVGLALQVALVQVELVIEAELVLQVVWVVQSGAARAVGKGWLVEMVWAASSPYFYLLGPAVISAYSQDH